MAWIARFRAGKALFMFKHRPRRDREGGIWCARGDEYNFGLELGTLELPSDADEKLIGRHITWEDEPIEI